MRKLRLKEENDVYKVTLVIVAKPDPAHKAPGLCWHLYYFMHPHQVVFLLLTSELQASHLFSSLNVKYLLVVKSTVPTNLALGEKAALTVFIRL